MMLSSESLEVSSNSKHVSDVSSGKLHLSRTATDVAMYGLLLGLGVLQFAFPLIDDDFMNSATYFELARSLIEKGFYGFNFKPETMLPPGFPAILAALCVTVGYSHTVMLRSIAIFGALGFITSYELLRREETRTCAVISCLLLASSPIVFAFSTRLVLSDMPYFFTSTVTVLLAILLDKAKSFRLRTALWFLEALFLIGSILIRSAGIALLTGLLAWLAFSFFTDREVAFRRLKTFIPLLLLGILTQGLWMGWAAKHEVLQWPMLEGWPKSYVNQLRLKDGNYPELGAASLADIPFRVARNLNEQAVLLTRLLTRKEYINTGWFSVLVLGPVLLILTGVLSSIRRGGGGLTEWYFIGYEAMYLLWPWYGSKRFFLPVAPLACLYLWRGGKNLRRLASHYPRPVGAFTFLLSLTLAVFAGAAASRSGNLQPVVSAIFWLTVSVGAAWMALTRSCKAPAVFASRLARLELPVSTKTKSLALLRVAGMVVVAALVVNGIAQQVAVGRENVIFDMTTQSLYADRLAGQWVAANTSTGAVIMARELNVVHHFSQRKIVWFPASSDPQVLMGGIRTHKVEFVIVSERSDPYWLPPESVCFESLLRAYPLAFRLVHEEPRFRVYKLIREHSDVRAVVGKPS